MTGPGFKIATTALIITGACVCNFHSLSPSTSLTHSENRLFIKMAESKLDQEIKRLAEQIKLERERKVRLEKEIKEKEEKLKEKLKSMTSSSGVKKGVGK